VLCIYEKFVGVLAARLATERCAPLTEILLQALPRNLGQLSDTLDSLRVERSLSSFVAS
jgi:hypothetical protein